MPLAGRPRERVVGPLELFHDLVVVVLVAQAAHHLAGYLARRGPGEFAAVCALVWIAWINGSLHQVLCGGAALVLCATTVLATPCASGTWTAASTGRWPAST